MTASDDESTRARCAALVLSNNPGSIIDHLSLSWASDEVIDLYEGAADVTVQWTTIEESNPLPGEQGVPHNKGIIVGPESPRVTIHHVLCTHHRDRCPAMAAGPGELINTVVCDVPDAFVHHNPADGEFHVIGNTFRAGPSGDHFTPIYLDDQDPGGTSYWLSQNEFQIPGVLEATVDDIRDTPLAEVAFAGASPEAILTAGADFAAQGDGYVPVTIEMPREAYRGVLDRAGAFPRDAVTLRTIDEVERLDGEWAARPPGELLEGLRPGIPPDDNDADGMADDWEVGHGLDPADGADHARLLPSGYSAIEEYVNEVADRLIGAAPEPASSGAASPGSKRTDGSPSVRAGDNAGGANEEPAEGAGIAIPAGVALVVALAAAAGAGVWFLARRRPAA